MTDLCEFEVSLMRQMAGQIPSEPWGAAIGACLESLAGFSMVAQRAGRWHLTEKGESELASRGLK